MRPFIQVLVVVKVRSSKRNKGGRKWLEWLCK